MITHNYNHQALKRTHTYLMEKGFPYHSVSVIERPQDLGFHVFFMESVKGLVTEEIKQTLKFRDFSYSFVGE